MKREVSIDRLHIHVRNATPALARELGAELGPQLLRGLAGSARLRRGIGVTKVGRVQAGQARVGILRDTAKAVADRVVRQVEAVAGEKER